MKDIVFGVVMLFVGIVEFLINGFFCPVCSFSIFAGLASFWKPVCSRINFKDILVLRK